MAKQFISQSVLNAYAEPRKRFVHYGIILLAAIVVLCLLYIFWESGPRQQVTPSSDSHYSQVESGLTRNLDWLNRVDSMRRSRMPLRRKSKLHQKKPLRPVLSASHQPIDKARLRASSLVFDGGSGHKLSKVDAIQSAAMGDRIVAGEVLHAVLESAIQSDLPGPVRAMLSEPVYAYDSTRLLLPVGTRMIGEYQNKVTSTQERLGICWQRLVLPDGRSVGIEAPAIDPLGRTGVKATEINRHFWKRFGEAALYSLLSAGAEVSGGADADSLSAGQLLRAEVSDSFADTAMSMLEENKQTAVTLSLDPGSDISIFVRHDILF